jgi:hypothetical protein
MPKISILLLLLSAFAMPSGAQGLEFNFIGARFNNVILGFLPMPTGLDLGVNLPLGGNGLFFSLRAAGGFEDRMILRNAATGTSIAQPAKFDNSQWFNWPNAEMDAGLLYRLTGKDGTSIGKSEIFALARGRYEKNSPSLAPTLFPDAQGLLAMSAMAGVGFDSVRTESSRMKSGVWAEASFEYAPAALSFSGGTDFGRANVSASGFLPLMSWGDSDLRALSLYLAGYVAGDYAFGTAIPLYVLTSFGGRDLRNGLGDSVLGYQSWGYEAATKAYASVEARFVGPGLFGQKGIRPIAYAFLDAGFFDRLDRSPLASKSGIISSTGLGMALDVFDFAYLGLCAGYRLPIDDPLYSTYFPAGDKFFLKMKFLLQY